jgi:hypothetical protein
MVKPKCQISQSVTASDPNRKSRLLMNGRCRVAKYRGRATDVALNRYAVALRHGQLSIQSGQDALRGRDRRILAVHICKRQLMDVFRSPELSPKVSLVDGPAAVRWGEYAEAQIAGISHCRLE